MVTLLIERAGGSFTGPRAFTQRDWTIRVHRPEGFSELQGATCNGEAVPFEVFEKAGKAMPFALSGGAADGDVYSIKCSAPVDEALRFAFTF